MPALRHHLGMSSGRHKVVIEFEAGDGPPRGWISVDGGRQRTFYGWMDLTAHLESLSGLSPGRGDPHARVQRGV
jgi:hypothetical protein